MRTHVSTSVKVLLTAIVAAVTLFGYAFYTYDDPVKVVETDSGTVGSLTIGQSKSDVLSRSTSASFNPENRSPRCLGGWIAVSSMTNLERSCLLEADTWWADSVSAVSPCPERTNEQTSLHFNGTKLVKVLTICTPADQE
jgi:hypothetical protein